jgi:ATPase subunit of ABC transporter with duplicated ATPase domains
VLFSGEDVLKRVGLLSGGEAARLIFALLVVKGPTCCCLTNPPTTSTLEAIGALIEGLKGYPGTVLFVSHDRWFVSELATRIVEITPEGPRDFPGTYAEYLADAATTTWMRTQWWKRRNAPRQEPAVAANSPSATDWEEKKRRRNR